MRVGDMIKLNRLLNDEDLEEWRSKQEVDTFKITEINNDLVWVEGCPFAIKVSDIF